MEFEYMNDPIKESLSVMEWIQLRDILQSLGGIHLTKEQMKTLAWIASCEPETIENLIAIFLKIRMEGR